MLRKGWAGEEEEEEDRLIIWILFIIFRNGLLEGCAVPGSWSELQRERQQEIKKQQHGTAPQERKIKMRD